MAIKGSSTHNATSEYISDAKLSMLCRDILVCDDKEVLASDLEASLRSSLLDVDCLDFTHQREIGDYHRSALAMMIQAANIGYPGPLSAFIDRVSSDRLSKIFPRCYGADICLAELKEKNNALWGKFEDKKAGVLSSSSRFTPSADNHLECPLVQSSSASVDSLRRYRSSTAGPK